ncbi:hypothetical protein ACLB2K_029518 [Fragaria x ananassa]
MCFRWNDIHASTLEWLNQCSIDLSLEKFGELTFSLWSCWKERNDRTWKQKSMRAVDISSAIAATLNEFRAQNILSGGRVNINVSVKWKAPPCGVWKINVDGAFHQTTRIGGSGYVIRDFSIRQQE